MPTASTAIQAHPFHPHSASQPASHPTVDVRRLTAVNPSAAVLTLFMLSLPPALIPAGLGYLMYRIVIFKRWSDETPFVPQFLKCFVLMLLELGWENVMVW